MGYSANGPWPAIALDPTNAFLTADQLKVTSGYPPQTVNLDPAQYATQATAQKIASAVGGTAYTTQGFTGAGGASGPNQWYVKFPDGTIGNAGLIANSILKNAGYVATGSAVGASQVASLAPKPVYAGGSSAGAANTYTVPAPTITPATPATPQQSGLHAAGSIPQQAAPLTAPPGSVPATTRPGQVPIDQGGTGTGIDGLARLDSGIVAAPGSENFLGGTVDIPLVGSTSKKTAAIALLAILGLFYFMSKG